MTCIDTTEKDILLQFKIELYDDMKMSLNKIWWGVHWWVRSSFRNIWHEEIHSIMEESWVKMIKDLIHISFEYKFKTRYLDTTNCSVMNKAILDWLVESEILMDDTPQYVTSESTIVPIVWINDRRKMEYDTVLVTLYSRWMSPDIIRWEVTRERAKWKKRTTRGKNSTKTWKAIPKE